MPSVPVSALFTSLTAAIALLAAGASSALAQRTLSDKDIPDPNPEKQQAVMKLAPGLEMNLFASDPMIAKPIQMAWDAEGRLWVCSSAIYPQVRPGQNADDKIIVLEDTNNDGKADKSTVFTEGLLIPTGVWPEVRAGSTAKNGMAAYVANSTEILYMEDTDGDGRADKKEIVLSGFGTEDTHHILHSFKRGPDGMLYFIQSVYIHSHVETPYGTRRLLGSGIWQLDTGTGQLEVFSLGQVNPWGLVWDKWGQNFTTDGAYGEGINFTYPGATFRCLPDQRPRILKGLNPGQPKQAGLEIVNGRHFPEDWQGTLITNDFRGHRVNRFKVSNDGSGFASAQVEDVIATSHQSFRPIDVRMGPDGAVYIADWYNPIIQHGEVDFRDPRRDKAHGRVWRLTYKGRPLCEKVTYKDKTIPQLLDLLKVPEEWVRNWAKRELRLRDPKALSAAIDPWFAAQDKSTSDGRHAMMEALLVRQPASSIAPNASGDPLRQMAQQLFQTGDSDAQSAVVRWIRNIIVAARAQLPALQGADGAAHPEIRLYQAFLTPNEEILKSAIVSPHPRVRLEAINALREKGTAAAVELAMTAVEKPMDVNLDYALWLTAWELADVWLPAMEKGEITFGGNVAHLSFALKAANRTEGVKPLVRLIRESKVKPEGRLAILKLIGSLGGPEELNLLAELALDHSDLPEDQRAALLDSLTEAAKTRKVKPGGELNRVEAVFAAKTEALRAAAFRLAGAWKQESARGVLAALAMSPEATPALRTAAVSALTDLGGASVQVFEQMAKSGSTPIIKVQGAAALAKIQPDKAAAVAVETLASLTGDPSVADALFDAFLTSKSAPGRLAAALKDKKLPASVAELGLRKAGAVGIDTKSLQEALQSAGGLQAMVQQLSNEQLTALMDEVKTKGDAARGEQIYRRPQLICATCHAIGAAGGIIGPDLVSLGSSAPVDYIIESLLEPSKKLKEGFATNLITTRKNEVLTGFLARQDDKEIILRDAAGKTSAIPRADVAKIENVPVSLMPPGLTGSLRRDEFVDLVRFLSELGKEGAYKAKTGAILRRWRVLNYSDALQGPMNTDGFRALTSANPSFPWTPAYTLVDGTLPDGTAPQLSVFVHKFSAVQSEIEVTTPGPVAIKFDDASHFHVWFGDKEVPVEDGQAAADLPPGKHTITITWDHTQRKSGKLQAELVTPAGSPAKAQPVGGL